MRILSRAECVYCVPKIFAEHPEVVLRSLLALVLLASPCATYAQALPDAPSALLDTSVDEGFSTSQSRTGAAVAAMAEPNPLPIVNGRHDRPPTTGENFISAINRGFGVGAIGSALFSSSIQFARDRPDPRYWNTDAEGFGKRFGASYGQRVINSGTRFTLGTILHEDNRYLICHGCSFKSKLKNALLTDISARRGADGHRVFSPTGVVSGFSGSLVAYAFWYPHQDSRYTTERGVVNALYGFGTRPAFNLASEILDGRKIPLISRFFKDNPRRSQQVPVGWTGPLPPKHRTSNAVPDPTNGYADPPDPPKS